MPNLFYGKIIGVFQGDHDQFALDTPLGRIIVSGNTSIGVMAAANEVELHVFSGSATLKLWTMGLDQVADELTVVSGSSLRVNAKSGGAVDINRDQAHESWFVTPKAIAESQLTIPQAYVDAVIEADPIAYWRFERNAGGVMHNEVSERLHLRMVGDAVRWRAGSEGGSVEFGVAGGPGYLISDDSLKDDLQEAYSLELWAKPTYYHHGTLFGLIDWIPSQSPLGTHRMALELCGPVTGFTSPYRSTDSTPGRIRFIHEVRKNFDAECFSPAPYAVRRWQHIVAVKDAATMTLYVDGELVQTEAAAGGLASGLRVLMGQLFPESPQLRDEVTSRLFGGELDEVALYGRALDGAEIESHVRLSRPSAEPIQPNTQ
ncbi:LamG domain-containing protein [Lacipirellula sp.]|uniref:LamG domain-containing protein n=1 Tax=Lacipirellula sp. TaxID=2691419 RepID=UPI003D0B56FA